MLETSSKSQEGLYAADENFESHEAAQDTKSEKRSSFDRLKSRAGEYVKIALITLATLGPVAAGRVESAELVKGETKEEKEEKKEITEAEKNLLKEMQQLANERVEQASKDFPDISNKELDKFQQQAWDLAAFIVKNGGDLKSYKFSLDMLYKDTFQPRDAKEEDGVESELTEDEKSLLKEMQQLVNQTIEQISKDFKGVPPEKLKKFQKLLRDFSIFIVKQGGDIDSFKYGLNEFKNKHFAEEIAEKEAGHQAEAEQLASEVVPEALDSSITIDADWMWNNVDKVYRRGDTLLVVKEGRSKDMQMSINKAEFESRIILANLVKQARGGSGEDPTSEVLVFSSTRKMDIRQSEKGYRTVLVMEMPLADNIK